jgi:hypothetical protein
MNYLSFTFHTLFHIGLARGKQIIFIEAQPLTLALYGLLARWLLKVPYIYNTPDLQVEVAGEQAWIGRLFVKLATVIETFLMEHGYSVATVTPPFIEHFVSARGIRSERMSFLPNGVDLEHLRPLQYDKQCTEKMGVIGKNVLYRSRFLGHSCCRIGLDFQGASVGARRSYANCVRRVFVPTP